MNNKDDLDLILKEYFQKEEKSGISGSAGIMKRIRIYEADQTKKRLHLMGILSLFTLVLSGLTCVAAEYFIAVYPGWFAILSIPAFVFRIILLSFVGIELITFTILLYREFMDSIKEVAGLRLSK